MMIMKKMVKIIFSIIICTCLAGCLPQAGSSSSSSNQELSSVVNPKSSDFIANGNDYLSENAKQAESPGSKFDDMFSDQEELVIISGNPTPEQQNKLVADLNKEKKKVGQKKINLVDNEDTVIVDVGSYGRSNPFKPFYEKSLVVGNDLYAPSQPPLMDIPQPPAFNPDSSVAKLLKIKVNGILYDSVRSSAIINIDDNDYMVHKGDKVFDFYIKDISRDKITVRAGNNLYKAGIGEIIEGQVDSNSPSMPGLQRANSLPELNF